MPPKRVIIVRTVFCILSLWTCWFLYQLARPGTDISAEMMSKFSRAVESSYESSRLVYAASVSVGLCAYYWIDLILPFVVDVASLIKTAVGPLWNLVSPLVFILTRHTVSFIQYLHETIALKYKIGVSLVIFVFFRVEKFSKIFMLNLIFFILIFDLAKPVIVNQVVRVGLFIVVPVILSCIEISRRTQSVRSLNLIVYLTLVPLMIAIESWSGFEAFTESKYAPFYFCPLWAGLVSLLMCLNTPIRLAGWGVEWLLEDLGIAAVVRKGFVPIAVRLSSKISTRYPSLQTIPDRVYGMRMKLVSFGLSLSSGGNGLSVSSLVRGRWSLFALIFTSIILIGYFAYTALTVFVSIAVWPWFFMESFKMMKLQIVSEYRSQLSFTLLFLGYEFFLVRSNFSIVAFFASMLHLPALLVFKVASGVLVGRLIDWIKPRLQTPLPSPTNRRSPQPSPTKVSPQPSTKKDD